MCALNAYVDTGTLIAYLNHIDVPLLFFSLAQASVKYGIALEDSKNQTSLDYILNYQPLEKVDHNG